MIAGIGIGFAIAIDGLEPVDQVDQDTDTDTDTDKDTDGISVRPVDSR
jgi:hypothetical protein